MMFANVGRPTGHSSASMSFVDLFFTFEGRIGRAQFVLGYVGAVAALATVALSAHLIFGRGAGDIAFLALLVPAAWSGFAICAKRWHDLGQSGWFQLLGCIPYLGGLVFLFLAFAPGTPGPNRFGPEPGPMIG